MASKDEVIRRYVTIPLKASFDSFHFRFGPMLIGTFLNCILHGVSTSDSIVVYECSAESTKNAGVGCTGVSDRCFRIRVQT